VIKKLVVLFKSIFKKYKLSDQEKEFIKQNKKIWRNNSGNKIETIVEGFIYSPTNVIEKARIAKAIEEKTNGKPLVLLRGFHKYSSNVYSIYKSFNINEFVFWWRKYLNPKLLILTLIRTLLFFKNYKTGKSLLKLTVKEITIGDLIYDSIIRTNLGTYTINKMKISKHFRHIFRAYFNCYLYDKLFNSYNIKNVVLSHKVYIEFGILARIAHKNGAKVFLKDMDVFKVYTGKDNIREHHLKIDEDLLKKSLNSNQEIKKANKYLNDRFSGNINQVDVKNAFSRKRNYSKRELFNTLNLQENKYKNVFIIPHAFSDSPHCSEKLLYKDYYDWLVSTLKIISNVTKINIFIKPHPSSYMWGEKGVVEKILEEIKINNVNIVPRDFNTKSIKNIGDYIITAQGTAGLEFSCFGIPAIIAGKAYYSGFGIAIESENKKQYKKKLKEIKSIPQLDKKTRDKAKMVLYLSFRNLFHSKVLPDKQIMPGDNYEEEYLKKYEEVNKSLSQGAILKDEFYQMILDIS
jgi:hypothetical protein